MIPKIIHYIWLGGKELPKIAKKCIASWKKFCPDYEIKRWDESNLDLNKYDYVKEAIEEKKYAFASDVLRFEKLYEFGGIYLDIDVELIKPLDKFLHHKCFSGFESGNLINPGVIFGCVAGNIDVYNILQEYKTRQFKQQDKIDETTVCEYVTKYFEKLNILANNTYQENENIVVYPSEYFSPINSITNKKKITKNTYSIHWFNASWYSPTKKFKRRIKKVLNIVTFGLFGKLVYKIKRRKNG